MIFFTADSHFWHNNIIKHCNRPFSSVEEMDKTIIDRWNSVVRDNDIVYHLGDFCWKTKVDVWESYVKQLKGTIHLIKGNHDLSRKQISHLFASVEWLDNIKYNKQDIILCHYAMRVWYKSHHDSWMLYGHSHNLLPPEGKQLDVGVDCHNFYPVSIDKVFEIMKTREDNKNLVGLMHD